MTRRKDIERHHADAELDERTKRTDDPALLQRLISVKNLYTGDTLGEAAERSAHRNRRVGGGPSGGTTVASRD